MNLLDLMNELGSRVRYGVGPNEKYKLMVSQTIPGQPEPFLKGGAEVNPEAERYLSNYLGAQQWGQAPADVFNAIRHLLDQNTPAYEAGKKGARVGSGAEKLKGVLMTLNRR